MEQTKQMSFLSDLEIGDAEISELFQEVDYHLLMHQLSKVLGHEPNEATKELLRGVRWVPGIFERITAPDLFEDIAFYKNTTGKGRLGEFYIAIITEAQWDPRKNVRGYDLMDVYKEGDKAGVTRIQVKTAGPLTEFTDNNQWRPWIVNENGLLEYDVLVIVALREDYNPCNASLFVIPASKLSDLVKTGMKRIPIATNRYWGGDLRHSYKLNQWYEYELPPRAHNSLRSRIAKIACRENFIILTSHNS